MGSRAGGEPKALGGTSPLDDVPPRSLPFGRDLLSVKGGARWAISVFARRSACRSGSSGAEEAGFPARRVSTTSSSRRHCGRHAQRERDRRARRPLRSPRSCRSAFESLESGRACDVSMACHWAVNMASSASHGKRWGHALHAQPRRDHGPAGVADPASRETCAASRSPSATTPEATSPACSTCRPSSRRRRRG